MCDTNGERFTLLANLAMGTIEKIRGGIEFTDGDDWHHLPFVLVYLEGAVRCTPPNSSVRKEALALYNEVHAKMLVVLESIARAEAPEGECICPSDCDCEAPDANPAKVSEHCPVHNEYPKPVEGCPASHPWSQP